MSREQRVAYKAVESNRQTYDQESADGETVGGDWPASVEFHGCIAGGLGVAALPSRACAVAGL